MCESKKNDNYQVWLDSDDYFDVKAILEVICRNIDE